MYRVANLLRPYDGAEMFDNYEDAEAHAVGESADDSPYGVWDNDSGILVTIVYQQQVFES
jgi:hypothetical protein